MMGLEELLSARYSSVERIKPDIFRVEKKFEGEVFSVEYFDGTSKLLDANFDIEKYQYDLLGEEYYSRSGSVRWNYYLNFVIGDGEGVSGEIENKFMDIQMNMSLARKVILRYSDLESYCFSEKLPDSTGIESSSPISIWSKILTEHGMEVVFDDKLKLDDVVDSLASQSGVDGVSLPNIKDRRVLEIRSIEEMSFDNYRIYPRKRHFEFGRVNLFRGDNAVGKTSLLESIELALCGATARNLDSQESYRFRVKINGTDKENIIERENNSVYRERDQFWYGNHYSRDNHLAESFSKFNFFDADAALRFSQHIDNDEVSSAISGVVFGPQAIQYENRFASILSRMKSKKRALDKDLSDAREKIANLESISDLQDVGASKESEIGADELKIAGIRSMTPLSLNDLESKIDSIEIHASFLETQNTFLSSTTLEKVRWLVGKSSETEKRLSDIEERGRGIQDRIESVESDIQRLTSDVELYKRLSLYVRNDLHNKLLESDAAVESLQDYVSTHQDAYSKFRKLSFYPGEFDSFSTPVELAISVLKSERLDLLQEIGQIEEYINDTLEDKSRFQHELRQLKGSALDLIEKRKLENCPVCDWRHGNESLVALVSNEAIGQEKIDEGGFRDVEDRLCEVKKRYDELGVEVDRLSTLSSLVELWQIDANTPSRDVVSKVDKCCSDFERAVSELDDHRRRLDLYADKGYDAGEFRSIFSRVSKDIVSEQDLSEASVARLAVSLEKKIEQNNALLESLHSLNRENSDELSGVISDLNKYISNVGGATDYASKSRYFSRLVEAIVQVEDCLIVDRDATIHDVVDHCKSVQALVSRLSINRQKAFSRSSALAELSHLRSSLKINANQSEGLIRPIEVLEEILSRYSLDSIMKEYLAQHIQSVENVFLSVHAPREFDRIDLDGNAFTLHRKDGSTSSIKQISTGQRAALALSLFLVNNSLLISGPRILLFDDPVAYTDDLNLLSFLDYLRQLSIDGDRQIFFATASSKLATIFARKFDFQSGKFKQFRFTRYIDGKGEAQSMH